MNHWLLKVSYVFSELDTHVACVCSTVCKIGVIPYAFLLMNRHIDSMVVGRSKVGFEPLLDLLLLTDGLCI